jgi:branched-chain amino acid transport system permease protein
LLSPADTLDAARMAALGIVALSLVPLTGFAGQVSLCQLSFAGIGALTMGAVGGGDTLWGVVLAAAVAGAVGAIIALPALRLEGLSLALATAAFAVALDRWVFTLPPFRLAGRDIDLFGSGSIAVGRISVAGWSSDSPARQLVLLSVVLGLLVAAVISLRTSRFGARLVALRDSEAACAVSGISIVRLKVTVFALSAAMAGLGGALYAGLLTSVTADAFSFVNGLPLFLTAVVGGITQASSGVFAGVSLGLLSVAGRVAPQLDDLLLIAPGLVGIGLGRHPSGVVTMIADALAALRRRRAPGADSTEEWEWLGLTTPWDEARLRQLDGALGAEALAAIGPGGGSR